MREYNLDLLDRSDYGGFWQRFVATIIDGLITYLPASALGVFVGGWIYGNFQWRQTTGVELVTSHVVWTIYYAYFWTSDWRATPGKRIMKLIVVTHDGAPLGIGRSLWRTVALSLSGLVIIGPLLVIFTQRRQGLHDLLAGTVVVKENAAERAKVAYEPIAGTSNV
jgi:uncharacterized RDD family membrane protein YckC